MSRQVRSERSERSMSSVSSLQLGQAEQPLQPDPAPQHGPAAEPQFDEGAMEQEAPTEQGGFQPSTLDSTLEIPNVAAVKAGGVSRKTVALAFIALGVVVLGGAAATYKLSLKSDQQAQSKQDSGPKPMAALGPLKKSFVEAGAPAATLPGAAAGQLAGASGPVPGQPRYAVPGIETDGQGQEPVPPIPLAGQGDAARSAGSGAGRQVAGTNAGVGGSAGARQLSADDAPMMLASTRQPAKAYEGAGQGSGSEGRSEAGNTGGGFGGADGAGGGDEVAQARQRLRNYQQQLGTLVGNLTKVAGQAGSAGNPGPSQTGPAPTGYSPAGIGYGYGAGGTPGSAAGAAGGGGDRVLGLEKSNTPTVRASRLSDRSMLMPKGTAFTCSLKTRVISAVSGMVSCITARNVYSDDGRVLLVERGSHMDGEYRITAVKPGMTRIPVLWTRIRTPNGIVVDLDSPGTGALGEGGIDGHVDNRWGERIGAALLLSFIDDLVRIQVAESQSGTTVYGGTMKEGSKLAEKVLESTINIPPLIYQNQGATVGVYVARDVDFSAVYALRPTELR